MSGRCVTCRFCGRSWRARFGKAAAFGFAVAVHRAHETFCEARSPAERRAANKRDEARWSRLPPKFIIDNSSSHPGLQEPRP